MHRRLFERGRNDGRCCLGHCERRHDGRRQPAAGQAGSQSISCRGQAAAHGTHRTPQPLGGGLVGQAFEIAQDHCRAIALWQAAQSLGEVHALPRHRVSRVRSVLRSPWPSIRRASAHVGFCGQRATARCRPPAMPRRRAMTQSRHAGEWTGPGLPGSERSPETHPRPGDRHRENCDKP